jgi:hypothetical protein
VNTNATPISRPTRKVRFEFDERSCEKTEDLIAQGRCGPVDEIVVVGPSGSRVLMVPRIEPT